MNRWEELWQTGETPWDKGYAAPPLTEFLNQGNTILHRSCQVLVPGCGGGHDVRELARHGIGATGLDLAETAIAAARSYPPVGNETYITGDLFDSSWRAGLGFDAVWEHTCFCAIDPSLRPGYARAMAEILPQAEADLQCPQTAISSESSTSFPGTPARKPSAPPSKPAARKLPPCLPLGSSSVIITCPPAPIPVAKEKSGSPFSSGRLSPGDPQARW